MVENGDEKPGGLTFGINLSAKFDVIRMNASGPVDQVLRLKPGWNKAPGEAAATH
jgi:hypothetical protein